MARRVHVSCLSAGEIDLPAAQARHVRDVLRLRTGDEIELFDDAGFTARGVLVVCAPHRVTAVADPPQRAPTGGRAVTIASAIPRSSRADWMIEKLSELGVARFVPLVTARGVVIPEGRQKLLRWSRLAAESARQSRRSGVMQIEQVTPLAEAIALAAAPASRFFLDPGAGAKARSSVPVDGAVFFFIGPEGGWTADEAALFDKAALAPLRLTDTILRIETAAIAVAAIACAI